MLDKKIAQKIADEVMSKLGYNINVMNEHAIIIGSGSPDRIGTFHETAMMAIRHAKAFEVTESEVGNLLGVKPGINLPIVDKGNRVIGVVGITGDPKEVRNIGKLVKMTAELIIEQQESMTRFYSHRNDKAIFLNTLISNPQSIGEREMIQWGQRFGYVMGLSRVALLICFKILDHSSKKLFLENHLNLIKNSICHSKDDMSFVFSDDYILIYKTIGKTEPWEIEEEIKYYIKSTVAKQSKRSWTAYVGGFYLGLCGYQKSFREASDLYRGLLLEDHQTIVFAHRHYDLKLYGQLDKDILSGVLDPYLKKIENYFGKGTNDAMMTMKMLYQRQFSQVQISV